MNNRIQALMIARELEAYQAVGTSKIAALLCDLVKQLEEYEQEIESLREQIKLMEPEQ
jgi:cell division protein FtsB